jgi:hypothetical protein
MTLVDMLKFIAMGLLFGAWIGWTFGRRSALKEVFRRYPQSRPVFLEMGMEDPARPWWRWRPATFAIFGFLIVMTLAIGFGEGWESAAPTSAPQAAVVEPVVPR